MVSFGASKTMNENLTIDAGFTHIMADNGEINKAVTAGTIRAKTKGVNEHRIHSAYATSSNL